MKVPKTISPRELKESEYEELVRLRAEIAYIKAENEVIKKEIENCNNKLNITS